MVIAALIAWAYLLNLLSYHVPCVERLITPPPAQVVRDGRLLRRNVRSEYLAEEELMKHLRKEGIKNLRDVKAAYIEGEGNLTAICRDNQGK